MKKWMLITILILSIVLLSCQKQAKEGSTGLENAQERDESNPIAEIIRNNLLTAIDQLEKGNVEKGAELILDAIILAKPSGDMPEGFESKILSAKDKFQHKNYAEGVDFISEALLIFKASANLPGEKDKEERTDIEQKQKKDEPSTIAETIRRNILSAIDEFEKGNADKGVILLLEALQLFSPRAD